MMSSNTKFGFGLTHLLAIGGSAAILVLFVMVQNGFSLPGGKAKLQGVGASASTNTTTIQPAVAKPISKPVIENKILESEKTEIVPKIKTQFIRPRG
jgi:hypothetical protein